jgi:membrane protein DedA with SNARE-associated domain
MFHQFFVPWFHWVHNSGFWGVAGLMAMESSIFPVPSELVVPPAAILAGDNFGGLAWVVFAGVVGSWIGSAITYWVSLKFGRPFIMRYGKYFLMPPQKVERAERFMHRYESAGIFFARLLPVVRHLISIPAGMIRMNFLKFSLLTITGSAIWCSVLAWLGWRVGGKLDPALLESLRNGTATQEGLESFKGTIVHESIVILGAFIAVFVLYIVWMRISQEKEAAKPQ